MRDPQSYGGECVLLETATPTTYGPYWVELVVTRNAGSPHLAVLTIPEHVGDRLQRVGVFLIHLSDGRQLQGVIHLVRPTETVVRLTQIE